jgi:hypothetical protein
VAAAFACLDDGGGGELGALLEELLARTGALWSDGVGGPATVPRRSRGSGQASPDTASPLIEKPPSAVSSEPVMKADSSEAR